MIAGLGIIAVPSSHAATATGQTTFKVILQPVVVLDYYSEIDLTINSAALQGLAGTSAGQAAKAISATAGGAALTTDAAIAPGAIDLTKVPLTISNAWAVRSIATSTGTTSVTIGLGSAAGSTATLTGTTDTTSTIGLSAPSTSFATLTGGTGFATPVKGDVKMDLDLSTAKSADTYAGATIYITATST
ncbi:MAG: hypothetical protein EPN49_08405 [Rhodanobacter sp.]|nr:MAG: hypothetical protein EPN49_08405 [Rhodanobacter sp.]